MTTTTPTDSPYLITRSRLIEAPAQQIFDVLAAPGLHSVIDGSDTVRGEQPNGPDRLFLGARFGMEMKIGVRYRILNRVVEFDEGQRIAWRHFSRHVWRYTLEPRGQATLVTEQWDARTVPLKVLLRVAGYSRRHPGNIERTLERLEEYLRTNP